MKHTAFPICVLFCVVIATITSYAENVDDRRQSFIKDFISYYQEAYQKEDLEYIGQFFSNDALILTETKKLKKVGSELVPRTSKDRPFDVVVENRKEYLDKLKEHFVKNGKISIGISSLRIEQHPKYPEIYGVNFFQIWDDVGSSDIIENKMPGYIFLMIDFRENEMEPIIHIRTWQPKSNIIKPSDKYQLTDFRIISIK